MTANEITQKLKSIGIDSTNCYPKTILNKANGVFVGLYPREVEEDFYFPDKGDKRIYRIPRPDYLEQYEFEKFGKDYKYQIPKRDWETVWEDKEFEEKPDKAFKEMTLREYACIKLKIPDSGNQWLDTLIKKTKKKGKKAYDFGPM
jgi:hypothetical protein